MSGVWKVFSLPSTSVLNKQCCELSGVVQTPNSAGLLPLPLLPFSSSFATPLPFPFCMHAVVVLFLLLSKALWVVQFVCVCVCTCTWVTRPRIFVNISMLWKGFFFFTIHYKQTVKNGIYIKSYVFYSYISPISSVWMCFYIILNPETVRLPNIAQ